MRHGPVAVDEDVFPVDPWALVEVGFHAELAGRTESLFALANGYVGVRGTPDSGRPVRRPATLVSGFHETWTIRYPEPAHGYATTGQTIVRVPDATTCEVVVDGEPCDPGRSTYRRRLDLRRGILETSCTWRTATGVTVDVRTHRLVSLVDPHLVVARVEIVADASCEIVVTSRLVDHQAADGDAATVADHDPRRAPALDGRVLRPQGRKAEGGRIVAAYRTARSGMTLACGMEDVADPPVEPTANIDAEARSGWVRHRFRAVAAVPVRVDRFVAYHASPGDPPEVLRARVAATLDRAASRGFDAVAADQVATMAAFWEAADVQVEGSPRLQQAVRWSLFQLLQASARSDGGIPAKGLTGEGYEGHSFWESEMFVLPHLVFTDPAAAAAALRHRFAMLPRARRRARELSLRGALFPWRTISGEPASAYFPAGTAQYHVNAAVVYALRRYVEVTGDEELLWDIGVEIAVETARMWADLGFYRDGTFHLHLVTGPDEYTALVLDNAYTNLMARMNLRYAAEVVTRMRREHPERHGSLTARLDLRAEEIDEWLRAAEAMYVGYDETLGVTPQDATFLEKERWDFDAVGEERHPLLLHFHPLVLYRHQVLKQPDVVMAAFLLPEEFTPERRRADFAYYDPITTGDSSLSPSIQAIVAAEVGRLDLAVGYLERTALMDLADLAGNTADGLHLAAVGGTWMALVHGLAGLRVVGGRLRFDPRLPADWSGLRFPLLVRGRRLRVDLSPRRIRFEVTGGSLVVAVRGRDVPLCPGEPVEVPLD